MFKSACLKLSSRSISVILLTVATLGVFALLSVAAAQSECVQALDGNGAVGGSWTSDCLSESTATGPSSPPSGTRYARYYSFTLTERSDVSITLESETDPYIFLLDGDGEVVAENDDIDTSGGNYNSQIQQTLAAGGYTVEATTYSREATGEFTLTLSGLPAAGAPQPTATPQATATPQPTMPPQTIPGAVAASGPYHACLLDGTGEITCLGFDDKEQVSGHPTSNGFIAVSVGGRISCAIEGAGIVECWGSDEHGQASPPSDMTFVSIISGGNYTCGLLSDDSQECWVLLVFTPLSPIPQAETPAS